MTDQNTDLQNQTDELQQKTEQLTSQSTMLETRIAAQTRLSEDPLLAYRLAQEAYKLRPDHENRKLIFSALSRIDLFYGFQTKGYGIEDFKEPFILLSGAIQGNRGKEFMVFRMNTQTLTKANTIGSRAWIVPMGETWRLLTLNFNGSGLDAIPVYELKDDKGKRIGEAVQARGLSGPKFIDNSKVSLSLHKDPRSVVWDLNDNRKQFIDSDTDRNGDTYFYQIYGALDTRNDGVAAAHYNNGLVLVQKDGKVDTEFYTPVSFDPSSFYSAAKWAADSQFLALNYFDRKRLGIWDPPKKFFVWLDPDKWIVDCYVWSLNGHLLAFSGRTENDIDVTVEIVDAESIEQSRRVIYRGNVPIATMAFLPGSKELAVGDRDGNLHIIQISTGQVIKTGNQKDLKKLFSTRNAFYSSSPNYFRVWGTEPAPAKYWLFQSSKERVYQAIAAADPLWTWLAVPFVDNKKTGGLELRKVQTGEKLELNVPDTQSMSLRFSDNGKWLILQTLSTTRIYDTGSWAHYDFTLQQQDKQFISLRILKDTVYAHALGNRMNNTSNEYDYIIKLSKHIPKMIARIHRNDDKKEQTDNDALLRDIEGWEFGNLYRYQSAGISSSPNSGWVYYIKCRDQALGARDCDVQFLPTDLERTMALYDPLLWMPTSEEFKSFLKLER